MILKKPYAFLIKNFKLIHTILAILYLFISFRLSSVLNYYNAFINNSIASTNAINYIYILPFFIIILSIIICIILFILMNYKKKPKLLYALLIILYILIFIILIIANNGLRTIYTTVLPTKTLLLYRDLLRILLILQYISVGIVIIRAIGFDLKKFNFSEDIHSLDIDINDDEEIELTMGVDKHKIIQKTNRKIRELKYYYKENKIFILITLGIIIFISSLFIKIDKSFINKTYNENEEFSSDLFNFIINKTYISSISYNGDIIVEDSSFLILDLNITPKGTNAKLNTTNMALKTNNNTYYPVKKYNNYFKDIGNGYEEQTIKTTKKYLLIYKITKEEINNNMYITYTGSNKAIKINISPINLDNNIQEIEYKIEDTIDFSNSLLNGSAFKINSYEINNKFTYTYKYTVKDNEYEGKKTVSSANNTILKINIESNWIRNLSNINILNDYTKIKYKIEETEYETNLLNDKSPSNSNDLYLEVNKNIENASSIWLEITIRNIKYKYLIK